MKKPSSLFMILVFLFTGCSSLTLLKTESDYEKINEKLKDKNVTVSLKNGEIIEAKNVVFMTDSVSFLDSESNIKRSIPTPEVKNIVINDIGKSIISAFLGGVIVCVIPVVLIFGGIAASFGESLISPQLLLLGLAVGALSGFGKGDAYGFGESESQRPFGGTSQIQDSTVPEPPWASSGVSENQMSVEGKVIVISERVGEIIDRQERDKYGLYVYINGFQSVEFRQNEDRSYWFYLRYMDQKSGTAKILKRQTDEKTIQLLREYINQFK
jgi:hypothetical protein